MLSAGTLGSMMHPSDRIFPGVRVAAEPYIAQLEAAILLIPWLLACICLLTTFIIIAKCATNRCHSPPEHASQATAATVTIQKRRTVLEVAAAKTRLWTSPASRRPQRKRRTVAAEPFEQDFTYPAKRLQAKLHSGDGMATDTRCPPDLLKERLPSNVSGGICFSGISKHALQNRPVCTPIYFACGRAPTARFVAAGSDCAQRWAPNALEITDPALRYLASVSKHTYAAYHVFPAPWPWHSASQLVRLQGMRTSSILTSLLLHMFSEGAAIYVSSFPLCHTVHDLAIHRHTLDDAILTIIVMKISDSSSGPSSVSHAIILAPSPVEHYPTSGGDEKRAGSEEQRKPRKRGGHKSAARRARERAMQSPLMSVITSDDDTEQVIINDEEGEDLSRRKPRRRGGQKANTRRLRERAERSLLTTSVASVEDISSRCVSERGSSNVPRKGCSVSEI
ncbi:uncharacterized protein LAESUDRAFT_750066 [Laetiporus sulphureus 93-53]|uniref:Uncharacterized protein n=1 Tax=Laetiporus sulphureus 93-53 TaxID=1314785 RepID=A0A165E4N2_9APHY|nr:uncharacterized protein LAESUDRAFT_750066 [Laetiporus sulphureus 93-53]KZT06231.1 hypothetical protein LAESUDRAFT_750066 [Laetiporus sulphureus 93-53]